MDMFSLFYSYILRFDCRLDITIQLLGAFRVTVHILATLVVIW